MIKALQKKFIIAAMSAVTILLVALIGGINIANCWLNDSQAGRQLDMLAETEGRILQQQGKPRLRPGDLFHPPIDEDTAMSLRFFSVRFDSQGQVVHKDTSRIASVSGSEAEAYARQAAEGKKNSGYISRFKYRAVLVDSVDNLAASTKDGGKVFLFLDVSSRFGSMLLVLALSVMIAGICWLLMLLLVVLLSRKAIRPIAQNIQKQKQFVTDAGHEIKTPLAVIQANIDAMELINGENKWSRNIRSQTVRLSGLMQNLLTLAKMDEENLKLSREVFDLSKLTEESLYPFYESASLRQVTVETDIQPEVEVNAERSSIQRLLSILFDNAAKYTNTQGQITVSLRKSGTKAVLRVTNTCAELPQADAGSLFDRFYRSDTARTQKNGGYGIGLSAAQAIVEAHKGRIIAEYLDEHTVSLAVSI